MKCRFIYVEDVGKVLIPGCWGAAISNDIHFCTCEPAQPVTAAQFERQRYDDVVSKQNEIIKQLATDNAVLIQENTELYAKLEKLTTL